MERLPVDEILADLVHALRGAPAVVLQAPTGAGKTTRVPPALLAGGLGPVFVLEPRRLAARAAARRMADEAGTRLGEEIGYHVRFDRRAGPRTRILVLTPGILLRLLQDDPFLEACQTLVFDEFHERGLDADLALAMARLLQQTVRPTLRLVVMSATLEAEALARRLGDCPIIRSTGRLHPVAITHDARPSSQPLAEAAAQGVARLLDETPGDLLVFLPGMREIRQTARELEALARTRDLAVLPLHGDLSPEAQDDALRRQNRRRIVLATNVAESSVTVDGITGVVDTGVARQLAFDAQRGLDRLELLPISKASADQRAGRAGRQRPGVCLRLWSEASHRQRAETTPPEITRVDLAGALLWLLSLGEKDPERLPWLDLPTAAMVDHGFELLAALGAVEGRALTPLGQAMARLPVHPRLARLLIEGQRLGVARAAAYAAALLSDRDPFSRSQPGERSWSDLDERVAALAAFARGADVPGLDRGGARFILQASEQMLRELPESDDAAAVDVDPDEALARAVLAAYPDRVIRRREPGGRRGVMVGGRGIVLAPGCTVVEPELFVGLDVDAGQSEALVRMASGVRREWLTGVVSEIVTAFEPESQRVVARKRIRYGDLLLGESSAAMPRDGTVAEVLAEAARARLPDVLPPPDSDGAIFLTRLRCLAAWIPELQLPPIDDVALAELLPMLCPGCTSFEDLRRADWQGRLRDRLNHQQRQALEREAPERLLLPSGNRVALRYEVGRPPVLAARIQELFGMLQTPRVAGGRVAVVVHLLAPNYRPQQVTDDLASFWANTYPVVRKELRARYPRHAWPEDPYTAVAESRPKRRQ